MNYIATVFILLNIGLVLFALGFWQAVLCTLVWLLVLSLTVWRGRIKKWLLKYD